MIIKILSLFLFFCFVFNNSQEYNYPNFDKRQNLLTTINKIFQDKNYTIIQMETEVSYKFERIGKTFYCIDPNAHLLDKKTNKKFKLIKTDELNICPNISKELYSGEKIIFNLYFEKIIENEIDSFDFINDKDKTSVYNITFSNNLNPNANNKNISDIYLKYIPYEFRQLFTSYIFLHPDIDKYTPIIINDILEYRNDLSSNKKFDYIDLKINEREKQIDYEFVLHNDDSFFVYVGKDGKCSFGLLIKNNIEREKFINSFIDTFYFKKNDENPSNIYTTPTYNYNGIKSHSAFGDFSPLLFIRQETIE